MSAAKQFAIFLVVAVIAVVGYGYFMQSQRTAPDLSDHAGQTITVAGVPVRAEVVSTEASRQQGLSGRDALAPNTGMLFVFESDGRWGFWMKDMKFGIDIVWVAADGTVVTIAKDVSPDTYPSVLYPTGSARYVVELPAGFADAHNLAEGQKIVI